MFSIFESYGSAEQNSELVKCIRMGGYEYFRNIKNCVKKIYHDINNKNNSIASVFPILGVIVRACLIYG